MQILVVPLKEVVVVLGPRRILLIVKLVVLVRVEVVDLVLFELVEVVLVVEVPG
jgi:hypothetical protein